MKKFIKFFILVLNLVHQKFAAPCPKGSFSISGQDYDDLGFGNGCERCYLSSTPHSGTISIMLDPSVCTITT